MIVFFRQINRDGTGGNKSFGRASMILL
jgi:hypothetical protein